MGNTSISNQYSVAQDNALIGRNRVIGTHTFPAVWVRFSPSDSHHMVYFITWEMHSVSYQFLIACEDSVKPTLLRRSGIKIPIFFPKHGYFSSIIFPPYGIL